jgi:cysteinyl-tRNA synthetase
MSWKHLGENFDIHGGGDDLIFPHHENEIAQSCCAFPGSTFAQTWLHVRMLQVNGEKMSKSLGNFFVLRDLLDRVPGEAVRYLLMRTHYRSVMDFSDAALAEGKRELDRFYLALLSYPTLSPSAEVSALIIDAICDDLNTPSAIAGLHQLATAALAGDPTAAADLLSAGRFLGLFNQTPAQWFHGDADEAKIEGLIAQRKLARDAKDFFKADEIRKALEADGILLTDTSSGTIWRKQ